MNWDISRSAFEQAISHTPAAALITLYIFGFFLLGFLTLAAVMVLLNDLFHSLARLRGRR